MNVVSIINFMTIVQSLRNRYTYDITYIYIIHMMATDIDIIQKIQLILTRDQQIYRNCQNVCQTLSLIQLTNIVSSISY